MKRSVRRALALVAGVAGAVATVALLADPSPDPAPAPPGDGSSSEVRQHPSEVEEYWTEERMRDADPAPMPEEN
ncbi:hypothetical protein [Streptomyces chumphonensis]|uniref:hypothetical protein n=1 Tax=Streptomyces chumphonensis TaxID=1214925 RepID=UPI003D74FF66